MFRYFKSNTYLLLVVMLATMFSCRRSAPSEVLSEGKMIEVLYDIQLAEAASGLNTLSEADAKDMTQGLFNGVMKKHDVTQDQLYKSLEWYSKDMNKYMLINDSVLSLLNAESYKLKQIETNMLDYTNKVRGRSRPDRYHLTAEMPMLSFSLDSTTIKRTITDFYFQFDVLGIPESGKLQGELTFVYRDTTIIEKMKIKKDSCYSVSRPNKPDSLLTKISGFVRLPVSQREANVLLYNIQYERKPIPEPIEDTDSQPEQ